MLEAKLLDEYYGNWTRFGVGLEDEKSAEALHKQKQSD